MYEFIAVYVDMDTKANITKKITVDLYGRLGIDDLPEGIKNFDQWAWACACIDAQDGKLPKNYSLVSVTLLAC